ncbi:MAG: hypothetical protein K0R57_4649 [Paenibacillaceae bacterium]|jgi:hypothetical protein|nr:hypothetical protein [Paenibacillaceae bacterium]
MIRSMRRYEKNGLAFLLAMVLLFSSCPVFATEDQTPEGFAVDSVVEAESTVLNNVYHVINSQAASGGKYVNIPEAKDGAYISAGSNDKCLDPAELEHPDIAVTFQVPATGDYYLWVKFNPSKGVSTNNNFYYAWDNSSYSTMWLNGGTQGVFTWATSGALKVTLTEGEHTFFIKHRIVNMLFDAFYLASSPNAVPPASAYFATDSVVQFESGKLNPAQTAVRDAEQAFGGKAVQIRADAYVSAGSTDKCLDPNELAEADASFTFQVPESGQYYLWIRALPTFGTGNNNFHIWWDQPLADPGTVTFQSLWLPAPDQSNYKWYYTTAAGATKVNLTAGLHTVYFTHRTKQLYLDALFLSKASAPPENEDDQFPPRTPLPGNAYPLPPIAPPAEHPRLLFKENDLARIRAGMTMSQNLPAADAFAALVQSGTDGVLPPGSNNYDANKLGIIEALAFDYAVNGNEQSGRSAISALRNYMPAVRFGGMADSTRAMGQVIFTASEVYDWCYDLLTDGDKEFIVYYSEYIAKSGQADDRTGLEIGYPPSKQSAVVSHAGEAQLLRDLLGFGIAVYDEYPDIYNYAAGRFFAQFVEPRNFWYESHSHHQGNTYGPYRFNWDLWSAYIFKAMSGQNIYSSSMEEVAYQWIYTRRPDGQLLRDGDDFVEPYTARGMYYSQNPLYLFAANYFGNAHFKYEAMIQNPNLSAFIYNNNTWTPVQALIIKDPALAAEPYTGLPYSTYLPSPKGAMLARTGWSEGLASPVAMAFMNIGEYWGANHTHLDAGTFQLYYKGILASESGVYDSYNSPEDMNYNKRTIAHNALTVYDPGETFVYYNRDAAANDGGQRLPNSGIEPSSFQVWMGQGYRTGEVLGREFGPDSHYPEYTYIKGDITDAYSDKVEEVLRSMLFMPLEDPDHPAVMIVMDKVVSADPQSKKAYLLHMQQEPQVAGNKTVVVNNRNGNNGRMVHETLLPANPDIAKIGGPDRQFEVQGVHYPAKSTYSDSMMLEAGWGRVEIAPPTANATDYFLNVMTVSDGDSTAPDLASVLMEDDDYVGAVVADRAAIFAKEAVRMRDNVSFTIPGAGHYKVFISGIREGTWTVDQTQEDVVATVEGGAVYFTVEAGSPVTLAYKNSNSVRVPVTPLPPNEADRGLRLLINKRPYYSEVKPMLGEDGIMVDGKAVFEALGATQVQYDPQTQTLTGITKERRAVALTAGALTAQLGTRTLPLSAAPVIVRGTLMIPLSFLEDAFFAETGFQASIYTVTVDAGLEPVDSSRLATIIDGDWDRENEYNGQTGDYAWDGDKTTLWSSGANGAWFTLEFDQPYTLAAAEIYLNNATVRRAYFELEYSMDGVEFFSLGTFEANGKTFGERFYFDQPVAAKYIRYVNRGSSRGDYWCGVNEIQLITGEE